MVCSDRLLHLHRARRDFRRLHGVFRVQRFEIDRRLQTALDRAKNDQRVVAALGTPIRDGMVPSGNTKVSGSSGEADLAIPISGPKGKATINVIGTKSAGEWTFSKLSVQVDGGEAIDLNESSAAGSTSDQEVEEETADERVESITLAREAGGKLEEVKNFKRAIVPSTSS